MHTLSNTPPRIHGGPDTLGTPLYDFSTNGNACGPCPLVLHSLKICDASHYPDPSYTALREQLAAFHGVGASRVLLAASASEFVFRITSWVAQQGGRQVSVPAYGYADYVHAAQAWGLAVIPRDAEHAPKAGLPLAWYCDPSSPMGQPDLMAELSVVTVLDRAYEPLRLHGTSNWSDRQLNRVWQMWTPNKALGLTGVRAGYVIAPADAGAAVASLEALCPSWPLGAHGVALLQSWTEVGVQEWMAQSRETLCTWKARQIRLLESLGWTCDPSQANFFCARPQGYVGAVATVIQEQLRGQGIKLRDATSFGLPGNLRVSVLAPPAQDVLAGTWQTLIRNQILEAT